MWEDRRILSGPILRDIAILLLRYPVSQPPKMVRYPPPWHLVSSRYICAIPHFATYRAIIAYYRERKLNPNIFFSNFSGAPGISRQNPGISRPKSLISLFSRDVSNFLAPTRSRGRPLLHWKVSGPKSLGLGSFLLPDINAHFGGGFGVPQLSPPCNSWGDPLEE